MITGIYQVLFILLLLLALVLLVGLMLEYHTISRLRNQITTLRRRAYRQPDPKYSVLLETPIGDFYVVKDYMVTGSKERMAVVYVYLPEDFGDTRETIKELSSFFYQRGGNYDISAIPKDDDSGADAYVWYARYPQNAPADMLSYIAGLLCENIVHPKGITRLA